MDQKKNKDYFQKSRMLLALFKKQDSPEQATFVQVQRLIWEKSIFPKRFPPCSLFLCSSCNNKTRDLSFCLQCGRIFCLSHFHEHHCGSNVFGVDLSTQQLFFFEKDNGRRFVFDPFIDYLILSAKIAVIEGSPIQKKITPTNSIFPARYSPMPLQNFGNTCWMNSLLQCLSVNPLLQKWFLSSTINIPFVSCAEEAVHYHICRFFLAQLNEATFSLAEYLLAVWTMSPSFATSNQCDSHEFFMEMRTKLDDFYKHKFESQVFSSIFNWQFKIIESCENCDNTRTFIESAADLILNIENRSSLNEALSDFLLGSSPRNCNNCQKPCKRQYYFNTLPPTLTISLVRASYSERSVISIQLQEELVLDKFISADRKSEIGEARYMLVGVVVRPGAGETGHYWANVKKCNRWYRCDDNSVQPVEVNAALNDDACLLFYVRKGFVIS